MDKITYAGLLRAARQITRRADDAEDLLQVVLMAALEADRIDFTSVDNRRWVVGALRKRAQFDARSAIRRRRRETVLLSRETPFPGTDTPRKNLPPSDFIQSLSPAQRTTALLALSGHTRREIAWLLRLTDAALRQRIREIRRRWKRMEGDGFDEFPSLGTALTYGRMRQSMLGIMARSDANLASHDPDGHIFVLSSQKPMSRQPRDSAVKS